MSGTIGICVGADAFANVLALRWGSSTVAFWASAGQPADIASTHRHVIMGDIMGMSASGTTGGEQTGRRVTLTPGRVKPATGRPPMEELRQHAGLGD